MVTDSDSVHEQVTHLCRNILKSESKSTSHHRNCDIIVRALRARSFEILLNKSKKPSIVPGYLQSDDDLDPVTKILGYSYCLYQWNLKVQAKKLHKLINDLSNCNNPAIDSVLLFLAHLADERPRSNKVECQEFRAVGTRTMPYLEFMPQIFEPPWSLDVPSEKSHPFNRDPGEGLTMRGFSPGNLKWCPHEEFDFIGLTKPRSLVIPKVLCLSDHQYRDEGYGSPSQDHSMTVSCSLEPGSSDIWELALNSRHAVTRTWESLGSLNPSREKPFLIEASTDCVQKVWKSKVGQKHLYMDPSNATNSLLTVLPRQKLIQDLKLMLVGVPSQTFQCHQKGDEFVISRRICVEGLSPGTLQAYCKDFLVAGSCCLRLKKMVSSSSLQEGLMLQALCGSLSSYLYLYRCAVMRLPDSQLLLQLRHQFDSLLIQITSLAFLCKVHPGLPGETLPEGVALLAYLYEEIQKVTRKDVARILYSALQACCQVYFRFLQKWLFEGMCHDTYTEFFIQEQSDLMTCRDREYWSKGHYLLTHAVPGFLHGLEQAIFKCGKAMNLLKICNPQDTLCVVLQSGYPDIECCLSSDRLHSIQYKWLSYQYRALAVSGMPLNLSRLLQRSQEEKFVFQWMIQSAQKEHLRVLKLERENEIAAAASAKDRQFIMMKQQITKQIEDKKERLKEDEIVSYESKKLQEEERKLINMEKAELETYYLFLTNEAEKRRLRANMKIEQMKNTSESVVNLTQLDMQLLRTGTLVVEPPLCSNDDQYVDSSTTFETASNRSDMDIIPMASTGSDKNIIPTAINRSDMGIIPIASNRSQLNIIPKTSNRTDIGIIPILGNESDMSIITAESTRSDMDIIPYASNRSDMNILPVTSNRSNMGVIPTASNKSDMGVIVMASNRSDAGIIPTASNRTNMDITRLERNRCDMGIVPTPSNKCDMEIIPTAGNISVMDIKPLCYQSQTTLGEVPLVNITNCVLDMGGRRSNCDAEDVVDTDLTAINIILQKSIILPLKIQASLVNNAVLKLFLEKEGLLSHLHSLRNYFFLLDGEFARNVTTGLFECMYDASTPADMLNSVTLNSILSKSLTRADPNADRLSFQVKYIPPHFSVSSPLCLDCVMLQYKVSWPLNIILTSTALNKYNEVFGFLLRLRRISWVLEEDFHHLKRGANESPEVLKSPQYHRLQLYRHEMTHFIHACQSYVTASVLQASWVEFLNNMQNAHTLDDLYRIHVTYVKLVLFRCLLNKQSAAIQKSLVDSLRLVLKFHGQLCSGVWQKKPGDDHYTHPKFSTLVHIYTTFHDLAAFIFKFATKIATTGYQPHLHALLQMLNMNGFYPQYF